MHQIGAAVDAHTASAKATGVLDQSRHQQAMGLQQVDSMTGNPTGQRLIGSDGMAHFLNVARWPDHGLAVDDRADLLNAEAVALNRQRGLNRVDAILPPQAWRRRRFFARAPASQCTANRRHLVQQLLAERQRRSVGKFGPHASLSSEAAAAARS